MNLKKTLKFRLKTRQNPKYEKWWDLYRKKLGFHKHHWLESPLGGKRVNSYMLVNLRPEEHSVIHYQREPTNEEIIEWLIQSLEDVFDYIERKENVSQ